MKTLDLTTLYCFVDDFWKVFSAELIYQSLCFAEEALGKEGDGQEVIDAITLLEQGLCKCEDHLVSVLKRCLEERCVGDQGAVSLCSKLLQLIPALKGSPEFFSMASELFTFFTNAQRSPADFTRIRDVFLKEFLKRMSSSYRNAFPCINFETMPIEDQLRIMSLFLFCIQSNNDSQRLKSVWSDFSEMYDNRFGRFIGQLCERSDIKDWAGIENMCCVLLVRMLAGDKRDLLTIIEGWLPDDCQGFDFSSVGQDDLWKVALLVFDCAAFAGDPRNPEILQRCDRHLEMLLSSIGGLDPEVKMVWMRYNTRFQKPDELLVRAYTLLCHGSDENIDRILAQEYRIELDKLDSLNREKADEMYTKYQGCETHQAKARCILEIVEIRRGLAPSALEV